MSGIGSWKLKLKFGDESKMEGKYIIELGIYSTLEQPCCTSRLLK